MEKNIEDKIKSLEDRVKKLEDIISNNAPKKADNLPQKRFDSEGKKQESKPIAVTKKGEINVIVTPNLQVEDEKGNVYEVGEEMVVKNGLLMGDKLLVLIKNNTVDTIKVSQRAKRVKEEALVTIKDDIFYAVSKFATHKLIYYDVLSRGVLKGFEVKITLPKDFEKSANVVLIDSVENSGGMNNNKNEINEQPVVKQQNSNIRVVEDDDLV